MGALFSLSGWNLIQVIGMGIVAAIFIIAFIGTRGTFSPQEYFARKDAARYAPEQDFAPVHEVRSDTPLVARGVDAVVTLFSDSLTIEGRGLGNLLRGTHRESQRLLLASLANIHYAPSGRSVNGYLRFMMHGETVSGSSFSAVFDNKAVFFKSNQQPAFERLVACLSRVT